MNTREAPKKDEPTKCEHAYNSSREANTAQRPAVIMLAELVGSIYPS